MMEPSIACTSDLGFTFILMGELRRGLTMVHDADVRADMTGHPPTIVFAASNLLRIGQILGDHTIVAAMAAKMRALGDRLASARCTAYARIAEGWLRMHTGDGDGVAMFLEGLEIMESYSHHTYAPFSVTQVAAALLRLGQIDAARVELNKGFELLDRTGARWCEPELQRVRGEIATTLAAAHRPRSKARLRATAAAVECFQRAINIASAQGARWWELQARFSLARILDADERADAMRLFRALHAAIDDGLDLAELRAIRKFLA